MEFIKTVSPGRYPAFHLRMIGSKQKLLTCQRKQLPSDPINTKGFHRIEFCLELGLEIRVSLKFKAYKVNLFILALCVRF